MSNPYMAQSRAPINENVEATLAEMAVRKLRAGEGAAASQLLLVAGIYAHLSNTDTRTVLRVVRQTLENAEALK